MNDTRIYVYGEHTGRAGQVRQIDETREEYADLDADDDVTLWGEGDEDDLAQRAMADMIDGRTDYARRCGRAILNWLNWPPKSVVGQNIWDVLGHMDQIDFGQQYPVVTADGTIHCVYDLAEGDFVLVDPQPERGKWDCSDICSVAAMEVETARGMGLAAETDEE